MKFTQPGLPVKVTSALFRKKTNLYILKQTNRNTQYSLKRNLKKALNSLNRILKIAIIFLLS